MFASQGALRSTGRKLANGLRSTRNHESHSTNSHGSSGISGTRALHLSAQPATHIQPISLGKATIEHSIQSIRPRTPPNQLFSATRNFVTNIFTKLSSPGIRVPISIPHGASTLGNPALHTRLAKDTIQSKLSATSRYALHTRSFGAGGFLPRAPAVPRPPVAMQMGLGTARNFSSGRPIFQNLVDNVPIALRAIYEADLDTAFARRNAKLTRPVFSPKAKVHVSKMKAKATKIAKPATVANKENEKEVELSTAELEQYFRAPTPVSVTTYILIPLAPTPTNRLPLATRDASISTGHFIPLHQVGDIHASHSKHALRVSTLFSRLDVANVWTQPGVSCTPFSGLPRKAALTRHQEDDEQLEGVCTFLKVEFAGWTLAEVRGVLGETGQGWCVFEEVWHDDAEKDMGMLSEAESESEMEGDETDSLFSPPSTVAEFEAPAIDPAQSFVMPTLDFSSSFLQEQSVFRDSPAQSVKASSYQCGDDPWADGDESNSSASTSPALLSRTSSSSSFGVISHDGSDPEGLGLIIDPPSENGWFAVRSGQLTATTSRFDDGPQDIFF